MSTEYYLENHDNKTYYFLGKGNWCGCYDLSVEKYDKYKENIVQACTDLELLKSFLNEPYNRHGNTPGYIIDKVAAELFLHFNNAKNIDVFSDDGHCPPPDYKEVGQCIYVLRS
jgi:hypothetical protein